MNLGPSNGMDWSRKPGSSEIPNVVDDFDDQLAADPKKFVVVHGACSFGHFQASKSGVHKGGLSRPLVKSGFVATRISVTTLNLEIVRALARGLFEDREGEKETDVLSQEENLWKEKENAENEREKEKTKNLKGEGDVAEEDKEKGWRSGDRRDKAVGEVGGGGCGGRPEAWLWVLAEKKEWDVG
ncbi:hypothetical protein ACS0TY_005270 [Phlomoides rotata]